MPWRYQICIAKFLRSYNDDLPENLGKNTAQDSNKSTSGLPASLKNALVCSLSLSTSTGSEAFFLLMYDDDTKSVLLSVLTLVQTICPQCWNGALTLPKNTRSPLSVDVRRSKTPLLKPRYKQHSNPSNPFTSETGTDKYSVKIGNVNV